MAPLGAKSKDRKVVVERSRSLDPQPQHHCEAGAINQREILIAIGESNLPGRFHIRSSNGFNDRAAAAQAVPEEFSSPAVNSRT